jgi:hypothetical protein
MFATFAVSVTMQIEDSSCLPASSAVSHSKILPYMYLQLMAVIAFSYI